MMALNQEHEKLMLGPDCSGFLILNGHTTRDGYDFQMKLLFHLFSINIKKGVLMGVPSPGGFGPDSGLRF